MAVSLHNASFLQIDNGAERLSTALKALASVEVVSAIARLVTKEVERATIALSSISSASSKNAVLANLNCLDLSNPKCARQLLAIYFVYQKALYKAVSWGDAEFAEQLLSQMEAGGLPRHPHFYSFLLRIYLRKQDFPALWGTYLKMEILNLPWIIYNVNILLQGCYLSGNFDFGMHLKREIDRLDLSPDKFTYSSLMMLFKKMGDFEKMYFCYLEMLHRGIASEVAHKHLLVDAAFEKGGLEIANQVFIHFSLPFKQSLVMHSNSRTLHSHYVEVDCHNHSYGSAKVQVAHYLRNKKDFLPVRIFTGIGNHSRYNSKGKMFSEIDAFLKQTFPHFSPHIVYGHGCIWLIFPKERAASLSRQDS